jgi:hypothetical protein
MAHTGSTRLFLKTRLIGYPTQEVGPALHGRSLIMPPSPCAGRFEQRGLDLQSLPGWRWPKKRDQCLSSS